MMGSPLLMMLTRLLWAVVLVITLKTTTLWPATSGYCAQAPSASYLEALQTANAFLWAWVTRNAEEGLQLMSDSLRAQIKDQSWLRQFVVGLSNPHHQAFEIGHGCQQTTSRYAFPVTLYEFYSGEQLGTGYLGILEVARQGEVWRVDRLPHGPDGR